MQEIIKNSITQPKSISSTNTYNVNKPLVCGDPTQGQFACDSTSIRVAYGLNEIKNNKWATPAVSDQLDQILSGPKLNLDGDFSTVQVSATLNFNNTITFNNHIPNHSGYQGLGKVYYVMIGCYRVDAPTQLTFLGDDPQLINVVAMQDNGSSCNFILSGNQSTNVCTVNLLFDVPYGVYQDFHLVVFDRLQAFFPNDQIVKQVSSDINILQNSAGNYIQLVGVS